MALPYWQKAVWHHGDVQPPAGRRVATIGRTPIYVRKSAWGWLLVFGLMLPPALFIGGEYPAFVGIFAGVTIMALVLHETGHAVAALIAGQQVNYAIAGLRVAAVNWGREGGSCAPRQVAFIAAAGPGVNLALFLVSAVGFAVTGHGPPHILFGVGRLVNGLGVLNLIPHSAPDPAGNRRRASTDGAVIVQAVRAARNGPTKVPNLLSLAA